MRTIWKFPLQITDRQNVNLPPNAQLLDVQVQDRQPCLWAMLDPEEPRESREIQIFGTGHPATDAGTYVATFQYKFLVFHVFHGRAADGGAQD